MRLVDVDELIEYFDEDLEGYDNREYILHMLDSKGRSARVEAIPVEWIVKWAWAFMDKNSEGYKMAMELLHDWEKENETEID